MRDRHFTKISDWAYGCANFGGLGTPMELLGKGDSEAQAYRNCDQALDLGLRHFDTANTYAGGESERILGKWLRSIGSHKREQVIVWTKVGNPTHDGEVGLRPSHIRKQIEGSLSRLQVDAIDLYYLHIPDPDTPFEESLECFHSLYLEGKIKALGASNIDHAFLAKACELSKMNNWISISCVQMPFNLARQDLENQFLPTCQELGIHFFAYSPLEGGLLTGKYSENYIPTGSRVDLRRDLYQKALTPELFAKLQQCREIANRYNSNLASLAYLWLADHPLVRGCIVAPRTPQQFEAIELLRDLHLSPEDRKELNDIWLT
ncbi:MAG: aldo/keto reductase [Bradymonadales bacterium]|nr:MAG: aldo/keto reductase [Bradymonadales bacterium]